MSQQCYPALTSASVEEPHKFHTCTSIFGVGEPEPRQPDISEGQVNHSVLRALDASRVKPEVDIKIFETITAPWAVVSSSRHHQRNLTSCMELEDLKQNQDLL